MNSANLLNIPLFAGLSEQEQRHILSCMTPLELETGEVLVREGDPGDSLYIINAGEVEIYKAMGSPEEHFLGIYGPGDFFGEVALLDSQGLRSASARARTAAGVLRMTAEDFHHLMQTQPALALQMTQMISSRLRSASDAAIRHLEAKNRALSLAYEELTAAHEQIIEKEKLEKELDIARQIQRSMLPERLPVAVGYTFGAHMQAARWLGGDFYDFFALDGDHIAIVVADVSDKGVPAALYGALTRALIRAEALRRGTPAATLQRVNSLLQEMSYSGQFVTVLLGVLELSSGTFVYARAGHELPMLRRADGSLAAVPMQTGMILGLLEEAQIDEASLKIGAGDLLLLISDGATDATDPAGERFGYARLQESLQACSDGDAQAICDRLVQIILAFQGDAQQFDDITMVCLCACS